MEEVRLVLNQDVEARLEAAKIQQRLLDLRQQKIHLLTQLQRYDAKPVTLEELNMLRNEMIHQTANKTLNDNGEGTQSTGTQAEYTEPTLGGSHAATTLDTDRLVEGLAPSNNDMPHSNQLTTALPLTMGWTRRMTPSMFQTTMHLWKSLLKDH